MNYSKTRRPSTSPLQQAVKNAAHHVIDNSQASAKIQRMEVKNGVIKCTVEFDIDPTYFNSMGHAKKFMIGHIKGLQKIINKYTKIKMKPGVMEISSESDKAVKRALERLGLI